MSDQHKATMPSAEALASFAALREFEEFQAGYPNAFCSVVSLRWFYRQNRAELIESGAVIELGGRKLINPPVFAQKAIEIGARVAASRSER